MRSPFDTFHIMIVKYLDPDTKYSPFCENYIVNTPKESSVKVLNSYPLDTNQSYIFISDAEAKYSSFGENFTH